MNARWARVWFGATGAAAAVGLIAQALLVAHQTQGHFGTPAARLFNMFCFFTVESNTIVMATTLLLALRTDRSSTLFSTFRLIGLIGITVTGVVYHVALAHLLELDGWDLFADQLLHTAVPILAVTGWLLFGPRRIVNRETVGLSLLFPAAYVVCTVIRGAIVHWYPYPFVDVGKLGYGQVAVNGLWLLLLYLGLAAAALRIDRFIDSVAAIGGVALE